MPGVRGPAYWTCLLDPLVLGGEQYTAVGYPSSPAPRGTLSLGAEIGKAEYHGQQVSVRRIDGVDPTVAVGISGRSSEAFLGPRSCPYSAFSNDPTYDDLGRCLRSPVWFTFDPPGAVAGATVVARSDRRLSTAVAGAPISLVIVPLVADYVPAHHGALLPVGHVAEQVSLKIPNLPPGLYEAVIACAQCTPDAEAGGTLFPAGSILISAKPQSSPAITAVSYVLAFAFLAALFLTFRDRQRRQTIINGISSILMGGGGRGGSSRR